MSTYTVGTTLRTTDEHPKGMPCIIYDGDSVFCTFPSVPFGAVHAKAVCLLLNAANIAGELRTLHKRLKEA